MSARFALLGLLGTAIAVGVVFYLIPRDQAEFVDLHLPPQLDDAAEFVGSNDCRRCHEKIWEKYQSHPMNQTLTELSGENLKKGHQEFSSAAQFKVHPMEYEVVQRGNDFLHSESFHSQTGELLYQHEWPVHFAIGSGVRGTSFITNRQGKFLQSPVSWYTQEQKWDLSPGYRSTKSNRFGRVIGDACLSCHSGRVARADSDIPDTFQEHNPFLEKGIGCEKCHGPGREHIAFQEGDLDLETDPIINPKSLSDSKRDAVCLQCHLSGNRILRYGRSDYDFRPGNALEDVWCVLLTNRKSQQEKAVTQVAQMHQSQCFIKSKGALGCISCHDAHSVPKRGEEAQFFREQCLSCHQQKPCTENEELRLTRNDACHECHMPKRNAADIAHTTQTDHRILRKPKGDEDPQEFQYRFFEQADERIPAWEVDRILGLALVTDGAQYGNLDELRKGKTHLLKARETVSKDPKILESLGKASFFLEEHQEAAQYLLEASKIAPRRVDSWLILTNLSFQSGDYANGLKYSEQLLSINPNLADAQAIRSQMVASFGDLEEAIKIIEQAVELNPGSELSRKIQAVLYEQAGRTKEAQQVQTILDELHRATLPGRKSQ